MNHFFSPDLIFDVAISNGTKAQENDGCQQISRLNENKTPAKRICPSDSINGGETPALSKVMDVHAGKKNSSMFFSPFELDYLDSFSLASSG
jgi:hypothetical protein